MKRERMGRQRRRGEKERRREKRRVERGEEIKRGDKKKEEGKVKKATERRLERSSPPWSPCCHSSERSSGEIGLPLAF